VAFIQDQLTRQVYQAAVIPLNPTTEVATLKTLYGSAKLSAKLYPNPVSDMAIISFSSIIPDNGYNMQIIDRQGKTVRSVPLAEGISIVQVETSNLPDGLYFVKINSEYELPITLKMLIIH